MLSRLISLSAGGAAVKQDYWIATLGGTGSEIGYGIAVDSSGNAYVTGSVSSQGAGGNDAVIAKYNSSGVIQWQRSLGGTGNDYFQSITVDSSGNIYLTGYTTTQGAGNGDLLLAKYNSSGAIQWQRSLGGTGFEEGRGVAVDSSGNVYVTGYTGSQGAGSNDILIAKYNSAGTIQWQRSLGGTLDEFGVGISVDTSGYIYITGYTSSQGAGGNDILLAKYNTSGVIQWQRTLGGTGSDQGFGITADTSGNVFVVAGTASQGAGGTDVLIAKYNSSGVIQWQRSLGGTGNDNGRGIAVDISGNVYVTGFTTSQGAGGGDVFIAKYNSSGAIQWQRSLGGSGGDNGRAIAVSPSGVVYVAGDTTSQGAGGTDALIVKLPKDGTLTGTYGNFVYAATTLTDSARTLTDQASTLTDQARTLTDAATTLADAATTLTSTTSLLPVPYWIATLGGSGNEYGYGVSVDTAGNSYVIGFTTSQGAGGNDLLLSKYDPSGVIQWQRSLGGTGNETGYDITIDASGNIYVTGYEASQGAGGNDLLIAKYNSSGAIQWQRSLGGAATDIGDGIAVDTSGNVYVVGYTASQGAGPYNGLVVKYNSSGVIQWQRSLGNAAGYSFFNSCAVDLSGNVYAVGKTSAQGAGLDDLLIVKYNTSGAIQWQRSLGGASGDLGNGIAVDLSGNVYVTGYTGSQGAGGNDLLLAKYNTSGTIQWQRILGGGDEDIGNSVAVDPSGNVYVTGNTLSQGTGLRDILLAKYNTSGTIQWQRSLGGTGQDYGQGVFIDYAGNVYVTGNTASQGVGGELILAKLPGSGGLTGTYGNFTYAARTLTDAAGTLTDSARTLTDAATTLTDSARTLTDSARTLTSTTTTIQAGP